MYRIIITLFYLFILHYIVYLFACVKNMHNYIIIKLEKIGMSTIENKMSNGDVAVRALDAPFPEIKFTTVVKLSTSVNATVTSCFSAWTPQNCALRCRTKSLGSSSADGFVCKNSRAHLSGAALTSPAGGYHLTLDVRLPFIISK